MSFVEMIEAPADDDAPPINCGECRLAPFTIYGPTARSDAGTITNLRSGIRRIPAQRILVREGEIPGSVHTLYSGWAFRYRQLSDGRRQILAFVIPGDIVTPEMLCSGAYPVPFSIKTLTDVCLCSFEIKKFSGMMSSEAQAERLKQMEEHYVGAIYRRMTDIGRRSAAGRLAQLILELERRLGRRKLTRGKTFDFPLRQEHLADALGLTTVYVNRTLANFRKDGLIELSRQEMTILDIRTLQEVAEEG